MKTLRPLATNSLFRSSHNLHRPQCRLNPYLQHTNYNRQQQRTFLSNPLASEPQTLTATRTLPYPAKAIYSVISDISSYSSFVPYCRSSTVTATSEPADYDGRKYPEEAKLVVGFSNDIAEEFTSRVYCAPERGIVEAVSGASNTSLSPREISHHHPRPSSDDPSRKGDVLSHLSTRWTLRPYPYKPPPPSAVDKHQTHKNHEETSPAPGVERTECNLAIEFQFANPVYGALSQAAAPKVAEKMIEAFEQRVRRVVEGPARA